MNSLRNEVRDRILNLVSSIEGDRKIVILDEWTLKIVDSVCSLHDILDSGAFLVEVISKKRQPYPTMQAVYFVSSTLETFDMMARDFDNPISRAYNEVHILTTGRIGEEEMQRLANSPIVGLVKSLKEVYIDYLALETRVFSVGLDGRFLKSGYSSQNAALSDLNRIARQITAACITLGLRPVVRYHRNQRDSLSPRLANILNDILEDYCAKNIESNATNRNCEILILSRTFDMITPLLHEFTFQSMIYDLLTLDGFLVGNRYKNGDKNGVLDESDSLWTYLRHIHIADCSSAITRKFRQFLSENKAASNQLNKNSKQDEVVSLNQLKEVMGDLPEFQEQKSQFALHMDIAEKCFSVMENKSLMQVAKVEQKIACGCDAEGDSVKDPWGQVAAIIGRTGTLSSKDRSRLLCLYFACCGQGMSDGEKKLLIDSARLETEDSESVRKYLSLLIGHWKPGKGDRKSKFSRETDQEYEVSRYVTELQLIVEDLCTGTLDPKEYPAISTSSAGPSSGYISGGSLRAKSGADQARASSAGRKSNIVFIIGGSTWSEARAIYQTSSRTKTECFLGTTHMIDQNTFLREL